jgi:hypothetical protein
MVSSQLALFALTIAALVVWPPIASPKYTDWSTPVSLGTEVNSPFADFGPALSKDGLQLYFVSDRPGWGAFDLWVSWRDAIESPWSAPVNLGPNVNTEFVEGPPHLSIDGHWLIFNSNRPGGAGMNDLWVSYRASRHDPLGWAAPFNLGGVNGPFQDQGPTLFVNELYFGSDRPGGPGLHDIYVTQLWPGGWFMPPHVVPELSSPYNDFRPSIRFDGLELFFFSDRPGSLGFDLWVAVRDSVRKSWSAPENLGLIVNSDGNDQNPHIAADQRSLYFASNRTGAARLDLYVSTRTRIPR